MPNPPVLCALELRDDDRRVVDYARSLAQTMGSTLHGVNVCDVPESPMPSDVDAALNRAEEELQRLLGGASRAEAHVRAGVTHTQILAVAERIGAQLVVLNSRARGVLRRALLGSTAEAVVRNADRAVLVLPDGAPWKTPRTVVVAHELGAVTALKRVAGLGIAEQVHVVHAVGPDPDSELTGDGPSSLHQMAREAAAAQLTADVETVFGDSALEVSTHVVSDSPPAAIQREIHRVEPDLIVVGRSRRSLLARVFMGTSGIKLIREAKVPVMMVPQD
ncbi:MAG: universal stress protein [Sandaracinaceae bacterium]